MMKTIKMVNILLLFTVMIWTLTGCLKNNGNILTSYGVGTIHVLENGTKYILFDQNNLKIKSNQIKEEWEAGGRIFTGFTINWDEQPSSTDTDNIYEANLNGTPDYFGLPKAFDTNPNGIWEQKFQTSDSLVNMTKPVITYPKNGPALLTIQTQMQFPNSGETYSLNLAQLKEYVMGTKSDTLLLVYQRSGTGMPTNYITPWYSFTLPDYPENINLIVRFKVKNNSFMPSDVNKKEGYYAFKTGYTVPSDENNN